MKILACHDYYQQRGGEDQIFADETWLLESYGHEVVPFTMHNDEIREMGRLEVAKRTLWNRKTYADLRDLIRRRRPDIMHCTNTFPLISPAAYYAARAEGLPVVQSLHNYRMYCTNGYFLRDGNVCEDCLGKAVAWPGVVHACYRTSRAATAVVAAMQGIHRAAGTWAKVVDLYVTSCRFARRKLIQGGIPEERIVVKPNFVHPDPGPAAGDGGYAVFVGRLSPEKGLDTLLAAWSRLPEKLPLKIVGDGPLAERVRRAAADDARIEWLGWRTLEEVCAIVGNAAFLLMTSIWYETFGRTMIEAFAKATPVIVSRTGAMEELVEDGRTGLHFTPGDPHDLVSKIKQLWADRPARMRMQQAAREEYESKYTARSNYRALMEIYARAGGHRMEWPEHSESPQPCEI